MQVYKHDGTTRKQNSTWISSNSENSDWQAANDPCNLHLANGWRIPMNMKWSNVMGNGEWDNYSDTYTSVLRLYAAGYLIYSVGTLNNRGSYGFYWSSSQYDSSYGQYLYFYSGNCYMYNYNKASGRSVRYLREL